MHYLTLSEIFRYNYTLIHSINELHLVIFTTKDGIEYFMFVSTTTDVF